MWKFIQVWVGEPFAVLNLLADIISALKNWGIIMEWLPNDIPDWLLGDVVRLILGLGALGYLIFLAGGLSGIENLITKEDRVSMIDLAKKAKSVGWDQLADSMESINLKDAILQSAIDGDIKLYGRPRGNPYSERYTRNSPLQQIPSDYFTQCNLGILELYALKQGTTEITGFANDNYKVYLQTADREKTYQDIHVKADNIKKWIRNARKEYQGRRQKA